MPLVARALRHYAVPAMRRRPSELRPRRVRHAFGRGRRVRPGVRGGRRATRGRRRRREARARSRRIRRRTSRMPELIEFVNAPYPAEAKEAGLEANVLLKLTIDKDGRVTEAEVLEPAGHGFDEAARDAALRFRFKPAMRDGQPIAVKIPYRYSFTLTEVEKPAPVVAADHGQSHGAHSPLGNGRARRRRPGRHHAARRQRATHRDRRDGTLPSRRRSARKISGCASRSRASIPIDSTEEVVAGEETDVTLRLSPVSEGCRSHRARRTAAARGHAPHGRAARDRAHSRHQRRRAAFAPELCPASRARRASPACSSCAAPRPRARSPSWTAPKSRSSTTSAV